MIGEHDDEHRVLPWVVGTVMFLLLVLGVILFIIFLMNRNTNTSGSTSEEVSSSIELSSSEEVSSSSHDDYMDVSLDNIKKYIKDVGEEVLSTSWTVKDIYSVNMYSEVSSSIVVYGFTIEEDDKYIRIEVDLEIELSSMEEVIPLIHDDSIKVEQYIGNEIYEVVEDNLVSKDSFKDIYKGEYKTSITYIDGGDEYHFSGIGNNSHKYISIDYLGYDHISYDIDDSDSHISGEVSTGRYYQLLSLLA